MSRSSRQTGSMPSERITIIGGGADGHAAAFADAKAGVEVTLVESGRLGGTCLNTSCIPSTLAEAVFETAAETAARP